MEVFRDPRELKRGNGKPDEDGPGAARLKGLSHKGNRKFRLRRKHPLTCQTADFSCHMIPETRENAAAEETAGRRF